MIYICMDRKGCQAIIFAIDAIIFAEYIKDNKENYMSELTEILPQVRVSPDVKKKLDKQAKAQSRSLSGHIRYILTMEAGKK